MPKPKNEQQSFVRSIEQIKKKGLLLIFPTSKFRNSKNEDEKNCLKVSVYLSEDQLEEEEGEGEVFNSFFFASLSSS
jgi:hypothetical protein